MNSLPFSGWISTSPYLALFVVCPLLILTGRILIHIGSACIRSWTDAGAKTTRFWVNLAVTILASLCGTACCISFVLCSVIAFVATDAYFIVGLAYWAGLVYIILKLYEKACKLLRPISKNRPAHNIFPN
jgi:hypothetical protein